MRSQPARVADQSSSATVTPAPVPHAFHPKMRRSIRQSGRTVPPLEPLKDGHCIDPQERIFLEAAERGDKHTVVRCLQGPHPVNINCTNILGRSAIQVYIHAYIHTHTQTQLYVFLGGCSVRVG